MANLNIRFYGDDYDQYHTAVVPCAEGEQFLLAVNNGKVEVRSIGPVLDTYSEESVSIKSGWDSHNTGWYLEQRERLLLERWLWDYHLQVTTEPNPQGEYFWSVWQSNGFFGTAMCHWRRAATYAEAMQSAERWVCEQRAVERLDDFPPTRG